MFFRILFASILLGSTIVVQLKEKSFTPDKSFIVLYVLIAIIFLLSIYYIVFFRTVKIKSLFPYIQIGTDTLLVTLIIFITGSFNSIFSFLYLVVIIYSSMIIFRKGSMIMAAFCSIQYGILIDLEYYGIIDPYFLKESSSIGNYAWNLVFFKVLITMVACFAVAFLSGLLSEQLRRTKKELSVMKERVERVEKMAYLGEMATGITHEIKNPLASLAGSIQILRKDIPYNPEHDKLMQIVLRETDRLNALVSNFLLFAKPPVGKLERVDLESSLAETIKLFEKNQDTSRRVSIVSDFYPNIWVEIDPVHLRQVMWNIILNAAEAIEGEGLIKVKTYPLKHNYACVEVNDTGCGMTKTIIQSIFNPFFTTKSSGTGLGLSIVHRILESYNSWLDVESEVGKGTRFTWKLNRIDIPT
ncbi:MAG: ATP-binding protein [Desulfobacterales bacterium]|jgi:two-component system sensor histidine kinase PilS (NtrC family)